MNPFINNCNEHREDRDILNALKHDSRLPGMSEADAVFLMHLDVPDAIRQKLRMQRAKNSSRQQ